MLLLFYSKEFNFCKTVHFVHAESVCAGIVALAMSSHALASGQKEVSLRLSAFTLGIRVSTFNQNRIELDQIIVTDGP